MAKRKPPPSPTAATPPSGVRGFVAGDRDRYYIGRNRAAIGADARAAGGYNFITPDPSIDIVAAIRAFREVLVQTPEINKKAITRLDEALEEASKPTPERREVKVLIEQAATYAKKAAGSDEAAEKLRPHMERIVAWSGHTWRDWELLITVA